MYFCTVVQFQELFRVFFNSLSHYATGGQRLTVVFFLCAARIVIVGPQEKTMKILKASENHFDAWLQMRKLLWPDSSDDAQLQEMGDLISSDLAMAFLMFNPDDEPVGFIEGALYLNPPRNYGYIEGWFVLPGYREQGFGGQLLGVLEEWFLHNNIALSLSDTIPLKYPLSPKAHAKYGYRELETLQIFIKDLGSGNNPENQHSTS